LYYSQQKSNPAASMSHLTPTGPGSTDPYDQYKVEKIEKNPSPSAAPEKPPQEPHPKTTFAAFLSLLLKKIINLFEETTDQGLRSSSEHDIQKHLIALKAILDTLKDQDMSQNSLFLNQFAESWHQLLEDVFRFRRETTLSIEMRSFISEFQHYPKGQQHTLGYYLTEFAGKHWLPFPYMDIIRQLHQEHQSRAQNSTLTRWSLAIDQMISLLSSPENFSQHN
jgi:hypothetical protein